MQEPKPIHLFSAPLDRCHVLAIGSVMTTLPLQSPSRAHISPDTVAYSSVLAQIKEFPFTASEILPPCPAVAPLMVSSMLNAVGEMLTNEIGLR